MSDDKPRWDTVGNRKSGEPVAPGELAKKTTAITPDRARMLVDKLGLDLGLRDEAAKALSAKKLKG